MKLNLKVSSANPRVEKIRFEPTLVELFDAYMQFYTKKLNATLTQEMVISEMLTSFIKSDRPFMVWYKERNTSQEKLTG
jgi:hypothetical protein